MSLSILLSRDSVIYDLKVSSKKQLMQELAALASERCDLEQDTIYSALLERERLGATSVGDGVAIPHARLPNIEHVAGVFVRLSQPIDYDAADEQPVDLIFLLLAPESANAEHLRALAKISRLFRKEEFRQSLRGADGADAIYLMLTEPQAKAA
jgi:PTS system nitrogen regulatory IIA component